MNTPSQTLLDAARSGNPSALGQLLEAYSTYLTLLVRVQIGPKLRGKVDPEDIVQEAFLEAHRQFPQFRGDHEASLLSWLRRILAGQLALTFRKYLGTQARDARLERQLALQLDHSSQCMDRSLVSSASTPSQNASRREQAVLLADALAALPPDSREIIILRHIEGLPFAQAAERMGRTEDSVQKLWVRALARLRQQLETL